jgi:hypothetical protein
MMFDEQPARAVELLGTLAQGCLGLAQADVRQVALERRAELVARTARSFARARGG